MRLAHMLSADADGVTASISLRSPPGPHAVFVEGNADIESRPASGEIGDVVPGVFDGMPGRFEKYSLLRIHAGRFERRYREERGIEILDTFDQARPFRARRAASIAIRGKDIVGVPAVGLGLPLSHRRPCKEKLEELLRSRL